MVNELIAPFDENCAQIEGETRDEWRGLVTVIPGPRMLGTRPTPRDLLLPTFLTCMHIAMKRF